MAKQLGYPCTDVIPLTQDASARKYFRLILKPNKESLAEAFLESEIAPSETAIFCYLNPKLGSHKNFIHVCNHIDIGPKILAYDLELGVTIQSCLGKYNYSEAKSAWFYEGELFDLDGQDVAHNESEYLDPPYSGAKRWHLRPKQLLNDFKKAKIPNLKRITQKKLLTQMEMFQKIFLVNFLGLKKSSELVKIINEIKKLQKETIKELNKQEWGNCHTDFEHRNIIVDFKWPYDVNPYISLIDFQDTCIGPEGIDLAGISVLHHESFKFHHLSAKSDAEKVRWGGIQRNMRILGTLANLYLEQNRSFRLIDLPRILSNLIYLIPNKYSNLKTFLSTNIQEDLDAKVSEITGNPLTSNQAMVLAAGYGKRMMPLTKKTPKPLLKVGGETLLDIHLNKLLDASFDDIFVNVSHLGDKIKKHVEKNYVNNITIIEEKKPLGTGGALINASKKHFNNDDWILVINADILCDVDLMDLRLDLKKVSSNRQIKAHLVGVPNPHHNENGDFSVEYQFERAGQQYYERSMRGSMGIVRIDDESICDEPYRLVYTSDGDKNVSIIEHSFTWSGISFIHGSVFDDFKVNIKSPFDSWSKIIKPLIQQRKVAAFCDGGKWIDVGTPNRLKLANGMLKEEN